MKNEYRHTPVMLQEVIKFLNLKEGENGKVFVDCTLGGAGHSVELAERLGCNSMLVGIDQDQAALDNSKLRLEKLDQAPKLQLVKSNFGKLDEVLTKLNIPGVDAILMDLGMSSHQIDTADRGFSFKTNCPLDMRMDPTNQTKNAARILNSYSIKDLIWVLRNFSDEKFAPEIAREIDKARQIKPIETSFELVDIVKKAIPAPARRKGGHPAKRTFQALRIEVNEELKVLKLGLDAAIRWLNPGGRLVVISYHSLEDKIVKETFNSFQDRCTCPPDMPVCVCGKKSVVKVLTKKPVCPSKQELLENTRSRSAKLRALEKLDYLGEQ